MSKITNTEQFCACPTEVNRFDVHPALLENSEFRKIGNDVLDAMKYSLTVVAANQDWQPPADTLEDTFHEALKSMTEKQRQQYEKTARSLLSSDKTVRSALFGRYGELPPERVKEAGFKRLRELAGPIDIDRRLLGMPPWDQEPRHLNLGRLQRVWGPITEPPGGYILPVSMENILRYTRGSTEPAPDPEVPFPGYYRKLEFLVAQLECVDETSEWSASDEIAIGGVAFSPLGDVTKFGPKKYEDFDSGESEWFKPPLVFASFEKPKPKVGDPNYISDTYGVIVTMAEVDQGGFGDYLDKLYQESKDEIKASIEKLVYAGLEPYVGPYIAGIAGKIAAWAVAELIEWIIKVFQDNYFNPQSVTVDVQRGLSLCVPPTCVFDGVGGRFPVPDGELSFYGHGGHYQVHYFWRLSDWVEGSGAPY